MKEVCVLDGRILLNRGGPVCVADATGRHRGVFCLVPYNQMMCFGSVNKEYALPKFDSRRHIFASVRQQMPYGCEVIVSKSRKL